MNIPGFTAEACCRSSKRNYKTTLPACGGGNGEIEAAIINNQGAFECGGTCPAGQLLCKGVRNCICCEHGCGSTPGGEAFCLSVPKFGGRFFSGISGGFSAFGY
jgi:hypothetical protein